VVGIQIELHGDRDWTEPEALIKPVGRVIQLDTETLRGDAATVVLESLLDKEVDLELSVRAAVNTGEGLVNLSAHPQSGEGMVTGDIVNTASRAPHQPPATNGERDSGGVRSRGLGDARLLREAHLTEQSGHHLGHYATRESLTSPDTP
jgi:hypothetical protein